MQPPLRLELRMNFRPVAPCSLYDILKGFKYAGFHSLEATNEDAGVGVIDKLKDISSPFADQVLHIFLGFVCGSRQRQVDIDKVFGQVHERAEVRQFSLGACAKKEHKLTIKGPVLGKAAA